MKTFIVSIEEKNSPRLTKFLKQPFFKGGQQDYIQVGIRGGDLTAKDYFKLAVKGRSKPLTPGELGCTLSHLEALKFFLDSDEEFALVLEDDAILPDDFCIEKLEQQLKDMQLSPQFLFSIGGIQMKECRKVRGEIQTSKLLGAPVLEVNPDFYHRICYTVSYVIDRQMAKSLIEYHKVLRAADDWCFIADMFPNSRIYMSFIVDHPVLEPNVKDPTFSTIEEERADSGDVPNSRFGTCIRYNMKKFFNQKYPENG